MEFSEKDLEAICFEDEASFEYKIVERNDWIDGGKRSEQNMIVEIDNKFYSLNFTRSGDYFSDYEYEFEKEDFPEVELKEVTVKKWFVKK